jgi:tetratricopeptide (TPR) repeat protein
MLSVWRYELLYVRDNAKHLWEPILKSLSCAGFFLQISEWYYTSRNGRASFLIISSVFWIVILFLLWWGTLPFSFLNLLLILLSLSLFFFWVTGVLYRDAGNISMAIDAYEQCLKIDPDSRNAGQVLLLSTFMRFTPSSASLFLICLLWFIF